MYMYYKNTLRSREVNIRFKKGTSPMYSSATRFQEKYMALPSEHRQTNWQMSINWRVVTSFSISCAFMGFINICFGLFNYYFIIF